MTEEYTLPTDATGRLTFRSWVCTEPNWDGGGVGVSTDGGLTWWLLPPQLNGFHDQISTANSNSPFFGEGIIDGSNVPNGCGVSTPRGYDLKTYDLSNLSGQSFKLRFSFFSDTFVEEDGWYIDDAGVEYDVFEPTGSWVSRPIAPDPVFGYGRLRAPRFCSTFWIRNSSPLKVIKTSRFPLHWPWMHSSTQRSTCAFGWPPTTPT